MTIGLFLDVDNTLTKGFIQQSYAEMVEVGPDYLELEKRFQSNDITSEDFGDGIIKLFNRTRFNEQFAYENFSNIQLKEYAGKLLNLRSSSIEIYFVSAGPSYYVQKLAEKFKIPAENVLCSEYTFDKEGKLKECNAVTPKQKRDFRRENARGHDLTIGIGDDEIHDSSFLDGCDIGLLTPKSGQGGKPISENHLWAPRLQLVCALVSNLDKRMKASAAKLRNQVAEPAA